jgi:hypothetical protein
MKQPLKHHTNHSYPNSYSLKLNLNILNSLTSFLKYNLINLTPYYINHLPNLYLTLNSINFSKHLNSLLIHLQKILSLSNSHGPNVNPTPIIHSKPINILINHSLNSCPKYSIPLNLVLNFSTFLTPLFL